MRKYNTKEINIPYVFHLVCVATRLPKGTSIMKSSTWNSSFATKKLYHFSYCHSATDNNFEILVQEIVNHKYQEKRPSQVIGSITKIIGCKGTKEDRNANKWKFKTIQSRFKTFQSCKFKFANASFDHLPVKDYIV